MKKPISHFMETFVKDLFKSLKQITKIFKQYNIKFIVTGGVLLPYYNYYRTTEDIDLIVDSGDRWKIINLPRLTNNEFKDLSTGTGKTLNLQATRDKIEIIYTGDKLPGNPQFIDLDNMSHLYNNIPVMNLKELIFYKINASLYDESRFERDFSDIAYLIKNNNLPFDYLNGLRLDIKNKYKEIWGQFKNNERLRTMLQM